MDTQAIQAAIDANDALSANIELDDDGEEVEEESIGVEAPEAEAPEAEKIPRYVAVMVTPDQYRAIKSAAGTKALSSFILQLTADVVGFKVDPPKAARRKYANKEEAKAAATARVKTKKEVMDEFLAKHAEEFAALLAKKQQEAGIA